MLFAPPQLPIAPRPMPAELFSSWLLRVAAANCVPLTELFDALRVNYPEVPMPYPKSLDVGLPPSLLHPMSLFCRVPVKRLQALDLAQRLPHLQRALVLNFPRISSRCPRLRNQRLGYAFCPLCLAEQSTTHVPWHWCLAAVTRCSAHRISLVFGCPNCGEFDPLSFEPAPIPTNLDCRSCGNNLADRRTISSTGKNHRDLDTVQEAYRAALLGVDPELGLLGKITARTFRTFVDDMVQILVQHLEPQATPKQAKTNKSVGATLPRPQMLEVIAGLVGNAAPTSDARQRRSRFLRSRNLWFTLLPLIPDHIGKGLEQASRHWPISLRYRLAHAILHRSRKRWPHSPFKGSGWYPISKFGEFIAVRTLTHEQPLDPDLAATSHPLRGR
jgi:hypothetical protein